MTDAELELLVGQIRDFVTERINEVVTDVQPLVKRIADLEAKVLVLEQVRKLED
jgi:hypothetical protein